jgi:hypothetical protein
MEDKVVIVAGLGGIGNGLPADSSPKARAW